MMMAEKLVKLGTIKEMPGLWRVVGASPESDLVKRHRGVKYRNLSEVYRNSMVGSGKVAVEFGGGDRGAIEKVGFDLRGSCDIQPANTACCNNRRNRCRCVDCNGLADSNLWSVTT